MHSGVRGPGIHPHSAGPVGLAALGINHFLYHVPYRKMLVLFQYYAIIGTQLFSIQRNHMNRARQLGAKANIM